MLILPGSPALSAFRLDKLAPRLSAIHPQVQLLATEFIHFADLDVELADSEQAVLESLLAYGPDADTTAAEEARQKGTLMLVVPRPGGLCPGRSAGRGLPDPGAECGTTEY